MKNIHVLPTDKPSRLHKIGNELGYTNTPNSNFLAKQQNIYITNSEEIKEGDWYFFNVGYASGIKKADGNDVRQIHLEIKPRKIILTTDQDLIKEGVQAIDDEFLEWFVKNPSCERVEVVDDENITDDGMNIYSIYKIIIPKEEPKQETVNMNTHYIDFSNPNADKITSASTTIIKQETLEEAAENYAKPFDNRFWVVATFKEGAKWQQEQDKNKYSEEDMLEFYLFCITELLSTKSPAKSPKELFEQFKKK